MISKIKKEIQKGTMPVHLISIEKKKKSIKCKDMVSERLKTNKFVLSPHYKTTI